jgi:hypothetical protein
VVTLLCVRPAAKGGLSKVVSAPAVHNAILARRPDLHGLLCSPYYHSREGEAGGRQKYYARTTYEDDTRPGHDRFLMRLWLSMPNSRALPAGFEALWGSIEPGAPRGGIAQAHRSRMER